MWEWLRVSEWVSGKNEQFICQTLSLYLWNGKLYLASIMNSLSSGSSIWTRSFLDHRQCYCCRCCSCCCCYCMLFSTTAILCVQMCLSFHVENGILIVWHAVKKCIEEAQTHKYSVYRHRSYLHHIKTHSVFHNLIENNNNNKKHSINLSSLFCVIFRSPK